MLQKILRTLSLFTVRGVYHDESVRSSFTANDDWGTEGADEEEIAAEKAAIIADIAKQTGKTPEEVTAEDVKNNPPKKDESTKGKDEEDKDKDKDKDKEDEKDADVLVKIEKKEITTDQFAQLRERTLTELGYEAEEFDALKESAKMKLYAQNLNYFDFHKSANEKSQILADEKKLALAVQKKLDVDTKELEDLQLDFDARQAQFELDKLEVEKRKQSFKDLAMKDPEDEIDDAKRRQLEVDQAIAKRDAISLENAFEQEKLRIIQETEDYDEKIEAIEVRKNLRKLQLNFPELRTSQPAEEILDDIIEDRIDLEDKEVLKDIPKVTLIQKVLNEYNESGTKSEIDKFYKIKGYTLKSAPSEKEDIKTVDKQTVIFKTPEEVLRDMAEKQKNQPPSPKGGGTGDYTASSTKRESSDVYMKRTGWEA